MAGFTQTRLGTSMAGAITHECFFGAYFSKLKNVTL